MKVIGHHDKFMQQIVLASIELQSIHESKNPTLMPKKRLSS
jgi:hypothetical protein